MLTFYELHTLTEFGTVSCKGMFVVEAGNFEREGTAFTGISIPVS
jgi:hypothetical protein